MMAKVVKLKLVPRLLNIERLSFGVQVMEAWYQFQKIGIGHLTVGAQAVVMISAEEFDILLETGLTTHIPTDEELFIPEPKPEPVKEEPWTLKQRLMRFIESWTS